MACFVLIMAWSWHVLSMHVVTFRALWENCENRKVSCVLTAAKMQTGEWFLVLLQKFHKSEWDIYFFIYEFFALSTSTK